MDDIRARIGVPVVTELPPGIRLRRYKLKFPLYRRLWQDVRDYRDHEDMNPIEWCEGMDDIMEDQLGRIQEVMNDTVVELFNVNWENNAFLRFMIKLNFYYQFKEPNVQGEDRRHNDYAHVAINARRNRRSGAIRYYMTNPQRVTVAPLQARFFTDYNYRECGQGGYRLHGAEDSKGGYKYVITEAEFFCYKKIVNYAGCAKDIAHANTKIVEGRIVKNILSPKNMCVIASLRFAMGLTNPNPVAERFACRTDHKNMFNREFKTTKLLPMDVPVLERLGDYYNTDIALVGESTQLSSKSRDSVVTLHYEKSHVWLVVADDAGYCGVCDKQYTSVKWLANHRRHCHRCSRCKRAHSKDLECNWCSVCQIYHPTSLACNESHSEFYRDKGNGDEEQAKLVVMKFKKSFLEPQPKQEVLHFDIETAQYPEMTAQVCINVEWSVKATAMEPAGSIIFYADSPILYTLGEDLICNPLYDASAPSRPFVPFESWRMYSSYGRDSMKVFVDFLKSSPRAFILNAYNGSRFDHIFLLREWQAQKLLVRDIAFQSSCPIVGSLITENPKIKHRIWDVCRHLCGSLASNAKSAGLVVEKDSFTDFDLLVSDEAVLKYQPKLQEYCRKDVQVLTLLYEVTAAEIYSKFGVHITEYITTSHMTYTLAFLGSPASVASSRLAKLDNLKQTKKVQKQRDMYLKYIQDHKDTSGNWSPIEEIYVYRRVELELVFRSALYGGRCYPTQPKWESSQLQAVREGAITYSEVDDYVLDLDANSLYPTAMSMPMPTGDLHRWCPPQPIPANLGIYRIKYSPNKKLYNAPLPSRSKDGGLAWTLEDGEGWYTSVDIDSARRFGYHIEYIEGYYWSSSSTCFRPYIDYLYTAKDKMKQLKYIPNGGYSSALYNQLKLLLNGLWGKTSQRPVAREVKQVKNEDDLIKFLEEHTNLQYVHCSENESAIEYWMQGDAVDRSGKISKPVQIADFVLAWSRSIMLDVMDTVDPGLTECSFIYTDTDSLFVKVNDDNKYRLESLLGPGMGQLSNDLCDPATGGKDGKVIRMVCPSPKAYSAEYVLDNDKIHTTVHAKGIHCSFFKTHKDEIGSALTDIVDDRDRYGGEKKRRAVFSWGSDGKVEDEEKDEQMYTADAPYMKKTGALGGFEISHSHITRKLGKTEFDKRVFYASDVMSVPIGYQK